MKEVLFSIGYRRKRRATPRAVPLIPSIDSGRCAVGRRRFPSGRDSGRGAKNRPALRLEGPQEEGAPDYGGQWKGGRHSVFGSVFLVDGSSRNPKKLLLIRRGVELSFDQGGVGGDGDGRKGVPANRSRT